MGRAELQATMPGHLGELRRPGRLADAKTGRKAEFDQALDEFCDEWNQSTDDDARFEKELRAETTLNSAPW